MHCECTACTMYILHEKLYTRSQHIVLYRLILCMFIKIVPCTLYNVHFFVYIVHNTTKTIHYTSTHTDEKLRADVEALDNTLFYLTQLEKNLHNDINITKRAANKAMEDINKAEYKKYLQVIG